jgi:predicted secreted hydrolase
MAVLCATIPPTIAQDTPPVPKAVVAPPKAEKTVGFPQDAGPHDATSSIEWWYFNSFFTTENGRKMSVVGSFFRLGLPGQKKGHYLIYSLTDRERNRSQAYSVMDKQTFQLLKSVAQVQISQDPNDLRAFALLGILQKGTLPKPHKLLKEDARVLTDGAFSLAMDNNAVAQMSEDGREWQATLNGDDWTLELNFKQSIRPPMLVGGKGMTGIKRPNEMYYLSLTRMEVTGSLTDDNVISNIKGVGWLDRQWGSPEFVQKYGWDWLGIQMEDGSEMILYRIRDINTGNILKVEGTILTKDGETIIDTPSSFRKTETWTDPKTKITFPASFDVVLPKSGYTLSISPIFNDQTIPVLGIGDAIWEGVVTVAGKDKSGNEVAGQGYMELVGYRKPIPKSKASAQLPQKKNPK